MYLYSRTKEDDDADRRGRELGKTIGPAIKKLYEEKFKAEFDKMPKDGYGGVDETRLDPEQKKFWLDAREEERKLVDSLGGKWSKWGDILPKDFPRDEIDSEEIGYWRKCWKLHHFLIDHFGDPGDDNCVNVYLTKENLEFIIQELKKRASESEEFMYSIDNFAKALADVIAGKVVFYHPWY